MKKLLIAAIAVLMLSGCGAPVEKSTPDGWRIVRFDGCEYIKNSVQGLSYFVYTHKGNCDNPIHEYKTIKPVTALIPTPTPEERLILDNTK